MWQWGIRIGKVFAPIDNIIKVQPYFSGKMRKSTKGLFVLIIGLQIIFVWSDDPPPLVAESASNIKNLKMSQASNSTETTEGAEAVSNLEKNDVLTDVPNKAPTSISTPSALTDSIAQVPVTPASTLEIPVTGSAPKPIETTTPISDQNIWDHFLNDSDTTPESHAPIMASSPKYDIVMPVTSENKNDSPTSKVDHNKTFSSNEPTLSRNEGQNVGHVDQQINATSAPDRSVHENEVQTPKPRDEMKTSDVTNVKLIPVETENPLQVTPTSDGNGNARMDPKVGEAPTQIPANKSNKESNGKLSLVEYFEHPPTEETHNVSNYISANVKNRTGFNEANYNKSTLIDLPVEHPDPTDYVPVTNSNSISEIHITSPPSTSPSNIYYDNHHPHINVYPSSEPNPIIPEESIAKTPKIEESSPKPDHHDSEELDDFGSKDNSLSTRDIPQSPTLQPTNETEEASSSVPSPTSTVPSGISSTTVEEDEETTPKPTIHQFFVDLKAHSVMCLVTLFILLAIFSLVFFFVVAIALGLKYAFIGLFKLCKKTVRCMKNKKGSSANEGVRDSGSLFGGVCVRPYVPGERQLNERDMY